MMQKQHAFSVQKTQKGAALAIGLILLLIMTALALAGSTSSITTSRLLNNIQKENAGLQAAQDIMAKVAADPNCLTDAGYKAIAAFNDNPDSTTSSTCTINGTNVSLTTITTSSSDGYLQVNINANLDLVGANNTITHVTQGFYRNFALMK